MTRRATASPKKQSAGLLLVRQSDTITEVLLAHPGGPFWKGKDEGAWTIPKGAIAPGEEPLTAAIREFAEETGHEPSGEFVSLGNAKQPGGKLVHVWALKGDWNTEKLNSNMFKMEWPPRSGRQLAFPEIDRAEWFNLDDAKQKILKGQLIFIDRLQDVIKRNVKF